MEREVPAATPVMGMASLSAATAALKLAQLLLEVESLCSTAYNRTIKRLLITNAHNACIIVIVHLACT